MKVAPPGWIVVQANHGIVEFAAMNNTFEILDIGLCDPLYQRQRRFDAGNDLRTVI